MQTKQQNVAASIIIRMDGNKVEGASLRREFYAAFRTHAEGLGTKDGVRLDKVATDYSKAAREALRAESTKKVVKFVDSLDKAGLADLEGFTPDDDPAKRLASRLTILKSRMSEAKRLFNAILAGDVSAEAVYEGTVGYETWRKGQVTEEPVTTGNSEGGEGEAEGGEESAYTVEKFIAAVSAQITAAEKAGILPDALAALATLVTERATVAK